MSSFRVLHLLAPARFGGLEKVVTTLSAAQAKAGFEVLVVPVMTTDPNEHPFVRDLESEGIATAPLHLSARAYGAECRAVRRLLEAHDATVLHSHGYRSDGLAIPIGWGLPVARVSTTHGFTGGGSRNRAYEWIQRRILRRFDAVVAVSEAMRADLVQSGISPSRVHLIRNAWAPTPGAVGRAEARQRLGIPPDEIVLGWVGRMSREKAPELVLEALAEAGPGDVALSMVGGGPCEPTLREQARRLGLVDRIRWHGVIDRAGRYVRAFDALFITSWTEGTPMTLLEAVGAGVPVVSTAVGGIPDVVSEDEAILVEPGDTGALARAIRSIRDEPDAARARAGRARNRVENDLAVGPWVRRYGEVYGSITRAPADPMPPSVGR